jgi:hypothetical protein
MQKQALHFYQLANQHVVLILVFVGVAGFEPATFTPTA